MTTKPELREESTLLPGLAAVAFFAVVAGTVVLAEYTPAIGYADGSDITGSIGIALLNLTGGSSTVSGEGFLSVLLIISMVLVGALVGAVMLARRESESVLDLKRGGEQ